MKLRAILILIGLAIVIGMSGYAQDEWQYEGRVGGIEWTEDAILVWTPDTIQLYDPDDYTLLHELTTPGTVVSVRWHDPYLLLTFEDDFHFEIWHPSGEKRFSGDEFFDWGSERVAVRQEEHLVVWDFLTNTEIAQVPGAGRTIFSPDLRHALHLNDNIELWQVDTMQSTVVAEGQGYAGAWKSDGTQFIITESGTATLIDRDSLDALWQVDFELPAGGGISVQWTPDESLIWGQIGRTNIYIWEPTSGDQLAHLDTGQFIGDVAWSGDQLAISFAAMEQQLRIWDARSGDQNLGLDMSFDYIGASWSGDGRYLAAQTYDVGVTIIEAASGVELASFEALGQPPLAWHPSQPRLLVGNEQHITVVDLRDHPAVVYADPAHELRCLGCHKVDGLASPLADIMSQERTLPDGTTTTVDEAYLRGLLTTPDAYIPPNSMPGLPAHLQLATMMSPEQVEALIVYIKGLSE